MSMDIYCHKLSSSRGGAGGGGGAGAFHLAGAAAAYHIDFPPNPTNTRFPYQLRFRARAEDLKVPKAQTGKANVKTANLSARRRERLGLPNYDDECHRLYPIYKFLSQPEGFKSILNTEALEDFQSMESNTYRKDFKEHELRTGEEVNASKPGKDPRCTLQKIQLLNFEVAPMLDLRVTSTSEDCTVEMLSCKFEGSKIVEQQNDRFSAFMKNHITWNTDGERFLDVDVKLNVSLEVYTRPFTLLPVSAIEKPGNLVMQSLVDRLVPRLLQQLIQDYENWVQEQRGVKW